MVLLIKWDNKVDNLIVTKSILLQLNIRTKKRMFQKQINFDDV